MDEWWSTRRGAIGRHVCSKLVIKYGSRRLALLFVVFYSFVTPLDALKCSV